MRLVPAAHRGWSDRAAEPDNAPGSDPGSALPLDGGGLGRG